MSRKVQVFKYVRQKVNQSSKRVDNGTATFLQFGVDYEEFGESVASFSVAIIEREDGSVESVPVHLIKFIEEKPTEKEEVKLEKKIETWLKRSLRKVV